MSKIPETLEPTQFANPFPVSSDEPWYKAPHVRTVLALGYLAWEREHHAFLNAHQVGKALDVHPDTVRRWARGTLPVSRRETVYERVKVDPVQLVNEQVRLGVAEESAHRARLARRPDEDWEKLGWLEPHGIYLMHMPWLRLWIPRISRLSTKDRWRVHRPGQVVIRMVRNNRFEAEQLKYELLKDLEAWRVQIPPESKVQGRNSVILDSAPLPEFWLNKAERIS
ncbi:hypothetical protein [Glutamicibacter sp. NPDC090743]|uniref:hypothetical protein n=1 Tax=Glutamicibacter sp. NPDC090743 TaxID=3364001 RepID=UPI00380961DF